MRIIALLLVMVGTTIFTAHSQSNYKDSLKNYQENYVEAHQVVTGNDKKQMHFFPVNEKYRVTARVEMVKNSIWQLWNTSGVIKKKYRTFALLHFTLDGQHLTLPVYQAESLISSEEYKNHLFLPFTDLNTGIKTYEVGRYIDLSLADIKENTIIIDFNKAYNPYCAYVSDKYNCPIPPAANNLSVAIDAGELKFH